MYPLTKYLLGIIIVLFFGQVYGQRKLSKKELEDLTVQSIRQVRVFFDNVEHLGLSELKAETRQKSINSTTNLFTINGTVEERSKSAKTGKTRKIRDYLNTLKARGQQRKTLISYDIIDNLTPNELLPFKNDDGSTSYKGTMIVRQFYCRLKEPDKLNDILSQNCEYSDTTDKKVYIEIKHLKDSQRDFAFAVLIDKVVVLKVK